jgi:phosphoglycolate phosphatase
MNSVTPALLVFDLDGTLVNSGELVAQLLNALRQELGKPALSISDFVPWLSLGGLDLISNGLGVSIAESQELLIEFRRRYRETPTPLSSVFDGVHEALEVLGETGHILSLCTNKPRPLAEKVLEETGLVRHFASICAGGDLATLKPDIRNIRFCLDLHPLHASNAVMIGDSCVDQRLAAVGQIPFFWFDNGHDDGVDAASVAQRFVSYHQLPDLLASSARATGKNQAD